VAGPERGGLGAEGATAGKASLPEAFATSVDAKGAKRGGGRSGRASDRTSDQAGVEWVLAWKETDRRQPRKRGRGSHERHKKNAGKKRPSKERKSRPGRLEEEPKGEEITINEKAPGSEKTRHLVPALELKNSCQSVKKEKKWRGKEGGNRTAGKEFHGSSFAFSIIRLVLGGQSLDWLRSRGIPSPKKGKKKAKNRLR